MITVSKDAIKYRDSNGQMQNIDILCQIGALSAGESEFGESYWVENLSGRDSYNNVFAKWKSEKIPLIDTSKATSMQRAFDYANIKELPPLDFTNVKDCYATFNHCESLTKVPLLNLASATRVDNMFGSCSVLEGIEVENTSNVTNWNYFVATNSKLKSVKTLDLSGRTTTGDLFQNSQNIETLLFVPNTIKTSITFVKLSKLSAESIQSIIDGLATVETQQTLTLHTDVKSKLTENQLTTITNKNWVLA